MEDFSLLLSKRNCKDILQAQTIQGSSPRLRIASQKWISTTIKKTVELIEQHMDIRTESILEDMQVNWSIIKTILEKDTKELEEARTNPGEEIEGKFRTAEHADTDKVIRHQPKKKNVVVSSSISSQLVKTAVESRKRLEGLESF